jgi:hypothetical protein
MKVQWSIATLGEHCPSCLAAQGQIHDYDDWVAAGIYPHSPRLYCGQSCLCKFVPVDQQIEDYGSLDTIPLRQEEQMSEHSERIQLTSNPTPTGFEIFAITAGIGNGWEFTPAVLQDSLELWNNAECFIDHSWSNRSIKDLAGICEQPSWDEPSQGIKLNLKPFGPGAEMLLSIGKELISKRKASIGFSADLLFEASGRKITRIVKVNSVDLVHKPARGGAFLRALNSERSIMSDQEISNPIVEDEQLKALRVQTCKFALDAGLAASNLPAPLTAHIRSQFADKVFTAAELDTAISDARKLVSDLQAPDVVHGHRIESMVTSEDQIKAAVSDMFGVDRDPGLEQVKPAHLTGIRELYHMLTGDFDMVGGFHPDRLHLATTLDFTGLVKNALNKLVVNHWTELGRAGYNWWERIVSVEHFTSLQDITGTLVGTVGTLPIVEEGAEYTELAIGDSPETATWKKRGGYIPLTLELIDRDETRKLKAYPRELASAALRTISALVAGIFTDNNGAGPTMADGGALFNATAVTIAGGHANLLNTALSAAQWEVVSAAVYNQPMLVKNGTGYTGIGPKMAVNPRYLLVPRALQLAAMKILYPTLENAANIYSENQQRGQPGDVITVPEWTDVTDFAAVVDQRIVPGIFIGERFGLVPEIFIANNELSPAVFMNDEHRLKVRHYCSVWVNDYRPLHKSNVAG